MWRLLMLVPGLAAVESRPVSGQQTHDYFLGPESIETVRLDSLEESYRIGDFEGPGMLEAGSAVIMAPTPDGGLLVFSAYSSSKGQIQHFHRGEIYRTFGRTGGGPGEYRRVQGLNVDPRTGTVWAQDIARIVSFSPDGIPGAVVSKVHAGPSAAEMVILPNGAFCLVGPGGTRDNLGFLLHEYDQEDKTWSSHYPLYRDSVFFPTQHYRKWRRRLALSRDGEVISVSDGYTIEVFDPTRSFSLVERIVRKPKGWPSDILADDERRRRENPYQPGFAVVDAAVDTIGRLWVASVVPEEDWEEDLGEDPSQPLGKNFTTVDRGMDTLVEVFDLSSRTVLASFRIDPFVRFIVGHEEVAYYLGDLPYPRYQIVRIPLQTEPSR